MDSFFLKKKTTNKARKRMNVSGRVSKKEREEGHSFMKAFLPCDTRAVLTTEERRRKRRRDAKGKTGEGKERRKREEGKRRREKWKEEIREEERKRRETERKGVKRSYGK